MKKFSGKKIVLLGSGGLRIGQAGEFDYSGSQAIKAIKEEGIETVLVNPNIATVQTDEKMADTVYLEPLNVDSLTKILEKERPEGILLSFGGQTALNLGLALEEAGVFSDLNVSVLGTNTSTIRKAEDRELFKQELRSIGIHTPKSFFVTSVEGALAGAREIGYPCMLRTGFSLGGLGSARISNESELLAKISESLAIAPHALIEEYLFGFKEIEYEIIRDHNNQSLSICNMENFDPMGIHTGESVVVAPSQTLNNEEYHFLRDVAIKISQHFAVLGECNVQFALHPDRLDYRVIEMNPRLSRSSALASKATGYPIAFVAAKIALGYKLHEIKNVMTKQTSAFFEPALDYITVKIPRWDTGKLPFAERTIGTEMKSVGEVMGIGRSFPEALQKAIRMLNIGSCGIEDPPRPITAINREIEHPTDQRLFALYQFFFAGGSVEKAHHLSQITPWFLRHIAKIAQAYKDLQTKDAGYSSLLLGKQWGFSDESLGKIWSLSPSEVRSLRKQEKIHPVVKQIDTLAGEYAAQTNYLYLTYHGEEDDLALEKEHVIVIGSGPYAIGSSVEFDWCAVNMVKTLRKHGVKTSIINCNPETVSTDFDESDRLYFEELTLERILDICDFSPPKAIVVCVGGQIANNLAFALEQAGQPLFGTLGCDIDRAENRERFSSLLRELQVAQPPWQSITSIASAKAFAKEVGYPILVRPSYVLSGSAMNIAPDETSLVGFLEEAAIVSPDHPVVISKFISSAKELEVDGVAERGTVVISAIAEHIENAGVHSGDATIVLPPQRLHLETIRNTKNITKKVVKALKITGPFNMQFIAKNQTIQVIECNARASRSLPFVSKITGENFMEIAAEIFLGCHEQKAYETLELDYVGVKTPQFSYQRLKGANPVARVEMASTGEVACIAPSYYQAFFSSWLATEQTIRGKRLLMSLSSIDKQTLIEDLIRLEEKGWELYATEGTHDRLCKSGVGSKFVHQVSEYLEPNAATLIEQQKVDLIINIPKQTETGDNGFLMRRLAIDHHIPLITNLQLAKIFIRCLIEVDPKEIPVCSWQDYIHSAALLY
ncbi:MAG: carbamoyl-phosphate synthase (glutamine-hydrolyzing) large subunit [Chlamydiota bacterium]